MPEAFDSRSFRNMLALFATGVTVVTSGRAPNFHGMTANAFSSLSLDPPLVLICVDKKANMLAELRDTGAFTVNILSADQERLSSYFADSKRPLGPDEFTDIPYTIGETGAPRLSGAICALDCVVHSVHPGGDHDLFIGEVKALALDTAQDPLLFYAGRYRRLQPLDE